MRQKIIHIDPDNVDADGISVAAAVAAAGNLTLGGTLTSDGVFTADYPRKIAIASDGADVGRTFTVTGTNSNGGIQTEDISGASVGSTESTKYFQTITSIAADDACAGNISVGTVDEFVSHTIPLNHPCHNGATIALEAFSGTIEVAVQQTFSDIFTFDNIAYFATHADITDITAAAHAKLDAHATGVRLKCNSYTDTAELRMIILQDGI